MSPRRALCPVQGMNRRAWQKQLHKTNVPRERGDEPTLIKMRLKSLNKFSESFEGNFGCIQNVLQRARFDDVLVRDDDTMLVICHENVSGELP